MFSKRPWWSLMVVMVATLLLAAQCGGAQPAPQEPAAAEPTEAPAAEEPAAEAPAATEEPAVAAPTEEATAEPTEAPATEEAAAEPASREGKVVKISYTQDLNSFNPLLTANLLPLMIGFLPGRCTRATRTRWSLAILMTNWSKMSQLLTR
ncbi:MAG: hypothetical protein HYR94_14310 [Chloroflexi bacterium]|nr:hypothetical protein [Chloroflexota bacterium]